MSVGGERLICRPAYRELGYETAPATIWLRLEAAEALKRAAGLLPAELTLVLWDGWRPLELQAQLYAGYRATLAAERGLTGEELERETRRFVAAPSADPVAPSPHLSGGAIDLTLGDAAGRPLAMGGDFDELSERSRTAHYERDGLAEAERRYRDRRRLLCSVMAAAGFSNYPEEWWHFDRGNQADHFRVGGPARYGAVLSPPG